MQNDADRGKTAQRLHRIKTCKIIIEFILSTELDVRTPDKKNQKQIADDLIHDFCDGQTVQEFLHNTFPRKSI